MKDLWCLPWPTLAVPDADGAELRDQKAAQGGLPMIEFLWHRSETKRRGKARGMEGGRGGTLARVSHTNAYTKYVLQARMGIDAQWPVPVYGAHCEVPA